MMWFQWWWWWWLITGLLFIDFIDIFFIICFLRSMPITFKETYTQYNEWMNDAAKWWCTKSQILKPYSQMMSKKKWLERCVHSFIHFISIEILLLMMMMSFQNFQIEKFTLKITCCELKVFQSNNKKNLNFFTLFFTWTRKEKKIGIFFPNNNQTLKM